MDYFLMNELAQLDVKWAGNHVGDSGLMDFIHSNPFYQFVMVTEGPVYLRVEDTNLVLRSGETYLLSPWQQHKGWNTVDETSSFFWVQFSVSPEPLQIRSRSELMSYRKFLHPDQNILRVSSETAHHNTMMLLPRHFHPSTKFEMFVLFEKLLQMFKHPQGYFRLRMASLLGQLLEMLACDALEHFQLNRKLSDSFLSYRHLVSLLNERYQVDLSKDYIEHHAKRKYEYLCSIFKKYSGFTIGQYVNQLRVQNAKHWLESTDESIAQISQIVGYKDPYYFSKIFRKITGITPSDYRASHRDQA